MSLLPSIRKLALPIASALAILSSLSVARAETRATSVLWSTHEWATFQVPTNTFPTSWSTGETHALTVDANHHVSAFGDGNYGECNVPADLTDAVAVTAGIFESFAVRQDGSVVRWGGSPNRGAGTPPSDIHVTKIDAGLRHAAAVNTDGTVVCWGQTFANVGQFDPPVGLSDVVDVKVGVMYTMALKSDGTVVAWGNHNSGPAVVPADLTDVKAISAGPSTAYALKNDGTVVAWGDFSALPSGLTNVKCIASSKAIFTVFVYKNDGTLWSFDAGDPDAGLTQISGAPTNLNAINCFERDVYGSYPLNVTVAPAAPTVVGGSTKAAKGTVTLTSAISDPVTFTLAATASPALTPVGTSVTIPAGQLSATYSFAHDRVTAGTVVPYSLSNSAIGSIASSITVQPFKVSKVLFEKNPVEGGQTVQATATLNAVPKRSLTVNVVSGSPHVVVPSLITFLSASKSFEVQTTEVATAQAATIGLTTNGFTCNATLNLATKPPVASLITSKSTAYGVQTITGTVTLGRAAGYPNAYVALSCPTPGVEIPIGVSVPEGAKTATFSIFFPDVTSSTSVTITATSGASAVGRTVTVLPVAPKTLTFASPAMPGGTAMGMVTVNVAPERQIQLSLAAGGDWLVLPTMVTIPAGSTVGSFPLGVKATAQVTSATVNVTKGAVAVSGALRVIQTVSLAAASFYGTQQQTATLTLSSAPLVDMNVPVMVTGAGVTAPAIVHVIAGSKTATFSLQADDVASSQTVALSAQIASGLKATSTVTVKPLVPVSVSYAPMPGMGYAVTVRLVATPGQDVTVTISNSKPTILTTPATFTVPAGTASASFAAAAMGSGTVRVSATRHGVTKYVDIPVTP